MHINVLDTFGGPRRLFHANTTDRTPKDVMKTEVLDPDYQRARYTEMKAKIKTEIDVTISRGSFKVEEKRHVSPKLNVLHCKLVNAIYPYIEKNLRFKSRFVVNGYRNRRKEFMVNSVQMIQPSSTRLLLAFCEMFDFNMWTTDVHQAYLQSKELLGRIVIIIDVPKEFKI